MKNNIKCFSSTIPSLHSRHVLNPHTALFQCKWEPPTSEISKGALTWYGKLTWESAHALEFDNIMFINCLWYDFCIYGVFEFLCNSIANL